MTRERVLHNLSPGEWMPQSSANMHRVVLAALLVAIWQAPQNTQARPSTLPTYFPGWDQANGLLPYSTGYIPQFGGPLGFGGNYFQGQANYNQNGGGFNGLGGFQQQQGVNGQQNQFGQGGQGGQDQGGGDAGGNNQGQQGAQNGGNGGNGQGAQQGFDNGDNGDQQGQQPPEQPQPQGQPARSNNLVQAKLSFLANKVSAISRFIGSASSASSQIKQGNPPPQDNGSDDGATAGDPQSQNDPSSQDDQSSQNGNFQNGNSQNGNFQNGNSQNGNFQNGNFQNGNSQNNQFPQDGTFPQDGSSSQQNQFSQGNFNGNSAQQFAQGGAGFQTPANQFGNPQAFGGLGYQQFGGNIGINPGQGFYNGAGGFYNSYLPGHGNIGFGF